MPEVLTALLGELSAVTDYRTLQDSLPRHLTSLLKCRSVLFYQRVGETLQFVASSVGDKPGWSAALLAIAHINPIHLNSEVQEACAWRGRHTIAQPATKPMLVTAPLIYRQECIGVLVAARYGDEEMRSIPEYWTDDEIDAVEAIASVVALLLENARLLERDQERIHELSLLNSMSSQMSCSLYKPERIRDIVVQRVREISVADLCEMIEPARTDSISWLALPLQEKLFEHFSKQDTPMALLIERPGDVNNPHFSDYLQHLPANVKTFFALPLCGDHALANRAGSLQRESLETVRKRVQRRKVVGIIVCAYDRPCKLLPAQVVLLQVLAHQASTVLENIRLEDEKQRLDRLATLGEMAANVAHEVRNPLASIKISMQMLLDDFVNDEGPLPGNERTEWAQESIGVALKEVERLDSIVHDLLLFARPHRLHRMCCHLPELIDRVLQLIQPQCREAHVALRRVYEELLPVWIDIVQMEQILLNICINALQAMPDGGVLTIACRLYYPEHTLHSMKQAENALEELHIVHDTSAMVEREEEQSESLVGQKWIEISVSDTGVGIAPAQLERIFQPFFTTKAHGIGLGLAITRRLVEDHGGYIQVTGQFGYGEPSQCAYPSLLISKKSSLILQFALIRSIGHFLQTNEKMSSTAESFFILNRGAKYEVM